MKFNRTLSFDGSRELEANVSNGSNSGKTRASLAKLDTERQHLSAWNLQPLDPQLATTQEFSPSFVGLAGVFVPLQNDFTFTTQPRVGDQSDEDDDESGLEQEGRRGRYSDAPHWPQEKCEKVQRVRFIICVLALIGIAFVVMSRMMLNVAIVQMVKQGDHHGIREPTPAPETVERQEMDDFVGSTESLGSLLNSNNDPLIFAATYEPQDAQDTTTTDLPDPTTSTQSSSSTTSAPTTGGISESNEPTDADSDGPHLDWSKQDINLILGSIYLGLIPGILLSGELVQRYGAKYPLFVCVFGSGVINMLTPTIASTSVNMMIASRVLMGLMQGALMPSMYELFNRWLTKTESSIFAPLIKVSMPLGSVIGTYMPGFLVDHNLAWPLLFYFGGSLCLLWSLVWLFVATSLPQANRFVEQSELNRIMRKKSAALKIIELPPPIQQTVVVVAPSGEKGRRSLSKAVPQMDFKKQAGSATRRKVPWLKIVTNPSVLVLMATKFTYNIGIDFMILQPAVYLKAVHEVPMTTISNILAIAYLLQMSLIVLVGWLAKTLVSRRALGLSVTKWRKIFQGGANFTMASCFLLLAYTQPNIGQAAVLFVAICLFWMLGAGGESMIPYDLSSRFTAPIVGFSHSVSMTSGLALTAIVGVVVGEETQEAGRWSRLFTILGALLAAGGILLICVLKAKPFLEAEKQKAREQAAAAAADAKQDAGPRSKVRKYNPAE